MTHDLPLKVVTIRENIFEEKKEKKGKEGSTEYTPSKFSGRLSSLARNAAGLAKENPKQLLANLGLENFSSSAKTKAEKIADLFKEAKKKNIGDGYPYLGIVFDDVEVSGNKVTIRVSQFESKEGKKINAVSQKTCAVVVDSLMLAAVKLGKVEWGNDSEAVVSKYDEESIGKVTIRV